MFRIGDFSRLARVSTRSLRYYDDLGLLRPVHVEAATGYRYYSATQLPRLNRILALKDLGMSLDQIARLLEDNISTEEIRGMLLMRRAEVERTLDDEQARLKRIESRLQEVQTHGALHSDDVIIKSVPSRCALGIRQVLTDFSEGRQRIAELVDVVPRCVESSILQEVYGMVFSDSFEAENIDAQLGFYVARKIDSEIPLPGGRVVLPCELPGVETMATVVRVGPPENAHLATAVLGQWLEANHYRLAGPNREVFLDRPSPDKMAQAVVEMQFPVEAAERVVGDVP